MEFNQLETFRTVLKLKSSSKAAEQLYLSQPAVSSQILALERELDTKLFVRTGKEIVPTKDGLVFYRHVCELLDLRERAMQSIQDIQNPVQGIVSIAASPLPMRFYLPQVISAFHKRYHNTYFRILSSESAQIVQDVAEGKVEIGMTEFFIPSAQCHIDQIGTEEWVVITPNNNRFKHLITSREFSLRHIEREHFITWEQDSVICKDFEYRLKQFGILPHKLKIVAECNDTKAIIRLVSLGLGIAIVARHAAEQAFQCGDILIAEMEKRFPPQPVFLVRNSSITLPTIAWKFHNFARHHYNIDEIYY